MVCFDRYRLEMILLKSRRFAEEYYKCWQCDKKIEEEEISDGWKCPDCNNLLRVLVKDQEENRVFIRKSGEDIKVGDIVDVPGSNYPFHSVLSNKKENKLRKIALKNHGVVKLSETDWLNCIDGIWDGNLESL